MSATGVLLIAFGEPEHPTREEVVPFLERIFYSNAALDPHTTDAERLQRCRELAERRAPGLINDYRRIGGSPLNRQAREGAEAVAAELERRGHEVRVELGMQFTDPTIADAVSRLLEAHSRAVIVLPLFPICGFSTNVAALRSAREAMGDSGVPFQGIAGWHHSREYVRLRAENIHRFAARQLLDLRDPDTLLYFSAHGTPVKYLEAGSRYDGYVEEHCRAVAESLGGVRYVLGYQNHANRGIPWTEPDNDRAIQTVRARRLVVEPVSFLHEQSETLAELDIDFREKAESLGLEFHRVPTPADRKELAGVFADLMEPFLQDSAPGTVGLHPCRCSPGSWCTNGHREVRCRYSPA